MVVRRRQHFDSIVVAAAVAATAVAAMNFHDVFAVLAFVIMSLFFLAT